MMNKLMKLQILSKDPVWVDQWPLTSEKLLHLNELVKEQLEAGHIEESNSPYNTPVFVIKKKSGKWRFLHDLREVNKIIVPMGALQCGLPNPNLISQDRNIIIIDLKDAFFTIPLHEEDKKLFAFTIPVLNHKQPTKRYQWKVLPQGMLNSPTMCQMYVDWALKEFRKAHPRWDVYHYMDDILVAAPMSQEELVKFIDPLRISLLKFGLQISPEKIQIQQPFSYLGHKMSQSFNEPKLTLFDLTGVTTLVELQKWLGNINWVRPYLGLTTSQLSPLFEALKQGKQPSDHIIFTKQQMDVIKIVQNVLQTVWTDRCQENLDLQLVIFGNRIPTAAIFQTNPKVLIIEWIHLSHGSSKSVSTPADQYAAILTKGRLRCKSIAGVEPSIIYVPCPLKQWMTFLYENEQLNMAMVEWPGKFSCHPPTDPRFLLIKNIPLKFESMCVKSPLNNELTVYTDGGKTYGACVWLKDGHWITKITPPQKSAQRAEIAAIILAFQHHKGPVNIICDSLYVYNLIFVLTDAYISPHIDSDHMSLFLTLQELLEKRQHPYFLAHIRSHQPFPGILTEGNAKADETTQKVLFFPMTITPWDSHSYFHQNVKALVKQFGITVAEATAIIQQCPTCSLQAKAIPMGVNPRGTDKNEIWQMDVTHYAPFAPWKYIHVTIDTYSGFIMASAQRGEKTKHVINHCIRTFSILGTPKEIKTDNGPAYSSTSFAEFLEKWTVVHKFGIPYNSQGQAIVERFNQTLKHMLEKIKKERGINPGLPGIQDTLNLALYTLNFLNLTGQPATTAAERQFSSPLQEKEKPLVYIRQLPDPTWKGPAQLITWGRGYAAVTFEGRTLWIPGRCVRPFNSKQS